MKWHLSERARPGSITPLGRLINTHIIRGLCVIIYAYIVDTLRADPDNPRPAPRKKDRERELETGRKGRARSREKRGERKRRISVATTQPSSLSREHSRCPRACVHTYPGRRDATFVFRLAARSPRCDIFETGLMLATGSRSAAVVCNLRRTVNRVCDINAKLPK